MAISKGEYQAALSAFPAGVTIVTSRCAAGYAVGATVSAFMALSLEPPLILVSLARHARTATAITARGSFVVHFVNEATASLARIFATSASDKFAGVRTGTNASDVPILLDCDIRLSCSLHAQHEGGDHTMFVGRVDEVYIASGPTQSVAWYDRRFCQLVALPEGARPPNLWIGADDYDSY